MLRFNTQKRRRSVTVLTPIFALCAAGITPATAAQATRTWARLSRLASE